MAIFPVGFLIAAPLVGRYQARIGRKNCLIIGVVAMTFSTLIFGLAALADDPWVFYTISMVSRFC